MKNLYRKIFCRFSSILISFIEIDNVISMKNIISEMRIAANSRRGTPPLIIFGIVRLYLDLLLLPCPSYNAGNGLVSASIADLTLLSETNEELLFGLLRSCFWMLKLQK